MVGLVVGLVASGIAAPGSASEPAIPHETPDFASEVYGNPWDFEQSTDTTGMVVVNSPGPPTYELPSPSHGELVLHPEPHTQLHLVRNWGTGAIATGRNGLAQPIDASRYQWLSFEATLPAGTTGMRGGVFWSVCAGTQSNCHGGRSFSMDAGRHVYSIPVHLGSTFSTAPNGWAGDVVGLWITPNTRISPAPEMRIHWARVHAGPLTTDPGTAWVPPEHDPGTGESLEIDARPRPVITDPDLAGGADYATVVRGGDAWDFSQLGDVAVYVNSIASIKDGAFHGTSAGPAPNDPGVVMTAPQVINTRRWHRLTLDIGYDGAFGLANAPGGGMVGRFLWFNPSAGAVQTSNDLVVYPGAQQVTIDLHTDPPTKIDDNKSPIKLGWGARESMAATQPRWDPHEDPGTRGWWIDGIRLARNDLADPTFTIRFQDNAWEAGTTARLSLVDAPGAGGGQALHTGSRPVTAGENRFVLDASTLAGQGTYWVRIDMTDPAGATTTAWSSGPVETGTPVEFMDVDPHGPFMADVVWAVKGGVADGYDPDTFGPGDAVSRQAMAAFLRRLLGPADLPPCTERPAPDITTSHPFCEDITWLIESGIAEGFPDGRFYPTRPVSRQAMAAFLRRVALGSSPAATCTTPPFTDVDPAGPFCGSITWLSATGITGGFADGTYRPTSAVSRQQMTRFLHLMEDEGLT